MLWLALFVCTYFGCMYLIDLWLRGYRIPMPPITAEHAREMTKRNRIYVFRQVDQFVSDSIEAATQTKQTQTVLWIDEYGCLCSDRLAWSVELHAPMGFYSVLDHIHDRFGEFTVMDDGNTSAERTIVITW